MKWESMQPWWVQAAWGGGSDRCRERPGGEDNTGDLAPQWPVTIPSLPVHREHHDRVLHDGAHTGLSCGLFHL